MPKKLIDRINIWEEIYQTDDKPLKWEKKMKFDRVP